MKYARRKTVKKAVGVAFLPVLVGEILPMIMPEIDRGDSYAAGTVLSAIVTGLFNWAKNRKRVV